MSSLQRWGNIEGMKDELSERISTPIVVNRAFFEAVELRLGKLQPFILEERANEYEVSLMQAQNFLSGRARVEKSKLWKFQRIEEATRIQYEISWENGISSVRPNLEEAIQTLEWEASKPHSLKISIGGYTPNRASFEIEGRRHEIAIRASGPRSELSALMESVKSLTENHAPQNRLLHEPWMPSLVAGFTFVAFFISMIIFSFQAGRDAVRIDPQAGLLKLVFTLAFSVVGVLAAASVSRRWARTFPTVEIPFGQGRNAARGRTMVVLCFAYIIIPLIIGFLPSLYNYYFVKDSPSSMNSQNSQ